MGVSGATMVRGNSTLPSSFFHGKQEKEREIKKHREKERKKDSERMQVRVTSELRVPKLKILTAMI